MQLSFHDIIDHLREKQYTKHPLITRTAQIDFDRHPSNFKLLEKQEIFIEESEMDSTVSFRMLTVIYVLSSSNFSNSYWQILFGEKARILVKIKLKLFFADKKSLLDPT